MIVCMSREVQVYAGGEHNLGHQFVWRPKHRRPVLADPVRDRCEALIRAKAAERGWRIITLEIMPDHVHLFVKGHPNHSPSCLANQVKGCTSHVLHAEFGHLGSRLPTLWWKSYFAATVGAVSAAVRRYIDTQYEWPWRKERAR